jgi:hypothetical protein
LLFQVLDHKKDCVGYFADNKIHSTRDMPPGGSTWEFSEHLSGEDYNIARIYSHGATLSDVCPEHMKKDWDKVKESLRAYLKACNTSKLSLDENCIFDIIPEYSLFEYLNMKNKITQYVLDTAPKPSNYNSMLNLSKMLADIGSRNLKIDIEPIMHLLGTVRGHNFLQTLQTNKLSCDYNPWGTITGRLASNPKSFPILTISKEFRGCVSPKNDWLVELDFNAAELRVLLALAGGEQPVNDIHDHNAKYVFGGKLTREDAKVKTFAWLYSNRSNKLLEGLYDKQTVRNKFWDGSVVRTDFGREIGPVDEHHSVNYIIQSTTIDMVHEQAYKVFEFLKGKKTFIMALIHDAVYLDLADEDRYELLEILKIYRSTRYGEFKVNLKVGKNLRDLKTLNL